LAQLTCEAGTFRCSDANPEKWGGLSSTIRQESTVCYSKTNHPIFPFRAGHPECSCLTCQLGQVSPHNAVLKANRIVRTPPWEGHER